MIEKFDLIMYLETIYKKNIKDITEEEMLKVSSITLEKEKAEDGFTLYEILKMFPNLKSIGLSNMNIDSKIIDTLSTSHIEELRLTNCILVNDVSLDKISTLRHLETFNCRNMGNDFYKRMNKNIKHLEIINQFDRKEIDILDIKDCKDIEELILEKGKIKNINELSNFSKLKSLSILWSRISNYQDTSFINNIPNLEELYLSKEYDDGMIPHNIKVYHDLTHLVTLEAPVELKQ